MQFRCTCDVITFILHTFYSEWLHSLGSVNSWGYFCVSFLHYSLLSRESNSITNMSFVYISDSYSRLNHAAMQNLSHYERQSKVSQKDISTAKVNIMLKASFDLTIDCRFIAVANAIYLWLKSIRKCQLLLANLCKTCAKFHWNVKSKTFRFIQIPQISAFLLLILL